MDFISLTKQVLPIIIIIGQMICVGLLAVMVVRQKAAWQFVSKNALLFGFLVALAATLGSLFYSEVAGYEPCKLCWLQRIFMYPQVILLGLAAIKKDYGMAIYAIILSGIGAAISAYHYLLQLGVAPALSCSAVGVSVSCSQRFVMAFGYITIPMMALTAFLLIAVLMAIHIIESKTKTI